MQSEPRSKYYSKNSLREDKHCKSIPVQTPHASANTSQRQPEALSEQQIQNPPPSSRPAPPPPPTNNSDLNSSELYRCWDSCCNGRTFSSKSNFARHQREKRRGRDAADLKCSFCGVGFTRATARHAHETERRCRNSGGNVSADR